MKIRISKSVLDLSCVLAAIMWGALVISVLVGLAGKICNLYIPTKKHLLNDIPEKKLCLLSRVRI